MTTWHMLVEVLEMVWLVAVSIYLFGIARKIRNERRRDGHSDTV